MKINRSFQNAKEDGYETEVFNLGLIISSETKKSIATKSDGVRPKLYESVQEQSNLRPAQAVKTVADHAEPPPYQVLFVVKREFA